MDLCTIHRWKRRHEDFCHVLKAGKAAWRGRPRGLAGPKVRAPAPCRPRREDFRGQYARPRETQAHNLAEQAVEAAFTAPDPQQGRLRFDALRWYAGKLLPKVYGERVEVETATRAVVSDEPLTADEWFELYGDKSSPRGTPTATH